MKLLKLNKTASSAMRTAALELRHYSTFCFNFPDASNCAVKLISVFTSRMQSFGTPTNSRCTEKPFNQRPRSQFYHLTATDTGLVLLYTFTRLGPQRRHAKHAHDHRPIAARFPRVGGRRRRANGDIRARGKARPPALSWPECDNVVIRPAEKRHSVLLLRPRFKCSAVARHVTPLSVRRRLLPPATVIHYQ